VHIVHSVDSLQRILCILCMLCGYCGYCAEDIVYIVHVVRILWVLCRGYCGYGAQQSVTRTYDSYCEDIVQRILWILCRGYCAEDIVDIVYIRALLEHTTLGILCSIPVKLLPRDAYAGYGSHVTRTKVYGRVLCSSNALFCRIFLCNILVILQTRDTYSGYCSHMPRTNVSLQDVAAGHYSIKESFRSKKSLHQNVHRALFARGA